jgi:hypothetical protein
MKTFDGTELEVFVPRRIGPRIRIHGTWSDGGDRRSRYWGTFHGLKEDMSDDRVW